jgi:hypothetical protein
VGVTVLERHTIVDSISESFISTLMPWDHYWELLIISDVIKLQALKFKTVDWFSKLVSS